jgi:hypothetical protein
MSRTIFRRKEERGRQPVMAQPSALAHPRRSSSVLGRCPFPLSLLQNYVGFAAEAVRESPYKVAREVVGAFASRPPRHPQPRCAALFT